MTPTLSPVRTIEVITAEIHELESQADSYVVSAIERKVEIGLRLIEAKELQPHGQFLKWAKEEFGWGHSHVQRHIELALNYPRVGNLPPNATFRAVRAAIAPPREDDDDSEDESGGMDVHFSSDSPEWYTPPEIITATVKLMGAIDLDPCSNSGPTPTVPATLRYTQENDGLAHEWRGRVYMNPPYGDEIVGWVEKLVAEYSAGRVTEAIALVPARVDTKWFREFRDYAICFVRGRLKFSGHDNSAPFPSAVAYLGGRLDDFQDAFSEMGDVWVRWKK